MFYQNLPLYLRLVVLLKELYQITHHLPKEYKFSLGSDLVNRNWELLDLFILAQTSGGGGENSVKKEIVGQINQKFEQFKLRVRFLGELKLVSIGRLAILNERLSEIGRMIGSWQIKVSQF